MHHIRSVNPSFPFTAACTAASPARPKSLTLKSALISAVLPDLSASAIAAAPVGPSSLFQRFKSVNTLLTETASAIALPPTGMRYADERRTLADVEASRDVIGRALLAAGRSSAVHARVAMMSSARVRGIRAVMDHFRGCGRSRGHLDVRKPLKCLINKCWAQMQNLSYTYLAY